MLPPASYTYGWFRLFNQNAPEAGKERKTYQRILGPINSLMTVTVNLYQTA